MRESLDKEAVDRIIEAIEAHTKEAVYWKDRHFQEGELTGHVKRQGEIDGLDIAYNIIMIELRSQ